MARTHGGASSDVRSSALWGTGSRGGDHRSRRVRGGIVVAAIASVSLVLPLSAGADDSEDRNPTPTYIAPAVYQAAQNDADGMIKVIIQSAEGTSDAVHAVTDTENVVEETAKDAEQATRDEQQAAAEHKHVAAEATKAEQQAVAEQQKASAEAAKADRPVTATSRKGREAATKAKLAAEREAAKAARKAAEAVREAARQEARAKAALAKLERAAERARAKRERAAKLAKRKLEKLMRLKLVDGVAADLPSAWLPLLEQIAGLTVTLDAPVETTALKSTQLWPYQTGASRYWGSALNPGPKPPAIAIVDSGIDRGVVGFGVAGSRVVHREVITTLPQNAAKADGRGHGTVVAEVAAGDALGYTGVAPQADLVDVDVIDDQGMARTSDVIKAAEWILKNKQEHNIRVANFSLHSSSVLSIRHHPLNKAVQQLWLNGVVVVAAAGNYGHADGTPSGVVHAPGNDPFVITVGAYDLDGSARIENHDVPSWSAYGYTHEGFAKPDVVAPGRSMVAPAPIDATVGLEKPERILPGGRLKLSGTSFAAPVVSGMAAQILAYHPTWTPDQVKGALMMSGRRMPDASLLEQGRGEVNLVRAITTRRPANPNAALNGFVRGEDDDEDEDDLNTRTFDAEAFYAAVKSDAAWADAAWADAAWADAAWSDAAWASAAWADAAWSDAAWSDAAWADSTTYSDNVEGEPAGEEAILTPEAEAALAADPELQPETTTP